MYNLNFYTVYYNGYDEQYFYHICYINNMIYDWLYNLSMNILPLKQTMFIC